MSLGEIVALLRGGILQIVVIAAPILFTALVVGLVVAILQAATSIQEQTLTFVPKVIAILAVLAFLGSWMFARLGAYTIDIFNMIPAMAGIPRG
ncbi:MAG: flagellar biosynthesis protein FliQ [Spirochaetaceae bacterium]|jgi:flagellar biosynthetic protein FliQ|nr:flagellar biosynthesis protein FliQ [Spirochaetaceae bacterium]